MQIDRYVFLCRCQVVTVGAGGAVKLWDISTRDNYPVASYSGHTGDVSSVNWNPVTKDTFLTGSWDKTVRVGAAIDTA